MTFSKDQPISPTKALYQYDESLRKFLARTKSVLPIAKLSEAERGLFKQSDSDTWVVETNETIFYAQGGGQPFDTGYMVFIGDGQEGQNEVKFAVDAVRNGVDRLGRILHFGHFENADDIFPEGAMVEQNIDGARRDLNSRIHTAGHTIALAVRHLSEITADLKVTELKAQHFPDVAFVDFQGTIDTNHKDAIQAQSTKFVQDALPIKLYWYKPEELNEKGFLQLKVYRS